MTTLYDRLYRTKVPLKCANLRCENEILGGEFMIVYSDGDVVGGHRPLELWMCAPCGEVLVAMTNPNCEGES